MKLDNVPNTRPVPQPRREADVAALVALARADVRHRRPRRVWVAAGFGVAALAAGGTASAFVLLPSRPATVHDSARCYTRVSSDFSSSFPGTTIAVATGGDVPQNAVATCAALWRQGFLLPGASGAANPSAGTNNPVPALTACVLSTGQAAVFPGDRDACARLGLSPMASGS